MPMKFRILGILSLIAALSVSCKTDKADEPFFETRGVVLAWLDLQNPEVIDWVQKMHDNGINTVPAAIMLPSATSALSW